MRVRQTFLGLSAVAILFAVAQLAHAADVSKAKCPVSGKPADETHAVDFNGGKVYFCCDKCPAVFAKSQAKFAAKADHQLVVTGQAKQEMCPITGKALDASHTVDVDGVTVTFCCGKCQAKVEKANEEQKLKMCFGPAAFKKAFKVQ